METPDILFHGSSNRCPILDPVQATDINNFVANTLRGVYATSTRRMAMCYCMGLIQGDDPCTYGRIEFTDVGARGVYVLGHPNLGGKGYLHVLPSGPFRYVNGIMGVADQWICERSVEALSIEEILVDEHPDLWRYATKEERQAALELHARHCEERKRAQDIANHQVDGTRP